jgi:phosphoribulokinase
MSKKHPVVAVTGSSGSGTTSVQVAIKHILRRDGYNAVIVEGDSFHRHDRFEMDEQLRRAQQEGRKLSHFGPEGNLFDRLEALFREYGESGTGMRRFYIHDREEAVRYGEEPGKFTPWETLTPGTDLLFYEGLHGGVVTDTVNVAQCPRYSHIG